MDIILFVVHREIAMVSFPALRAASAIVIITVIKAASEDVCV